MQNSNSTNDRPVPGITSRRDLREPLPLPSPHGLGNFARRVVVAILLLALAYTLWRSTEILLEAFAGVLFAVFLSALTDWVQRHTRLSHGWALTLVVIVLCLMAGGVGYLLSSRLVSQTQQLTQELPESMKALRLQLEQYSWGRFLLQQISEGGPIKSMGSFFQTTLTDLLHILVAAIVIIFVGIFGASEPDLYKEGLLHLVPPPRRQRAQEAVDAIAYNLRWWLLGQVFLMVIIGLTTMVGLWLLRIPLALTLGTIAGVLEIIPYAGPWLAAVPAALIAWMISPAHMLGVLGLYLFLHVLEGYVLLPLVQRRAVLMPPALTLVMQVLLGELLGFMGLFVAAPLTVSGVVLLKMLYVEDTLGDQNVDVPGEPGNETKPAAQENKEDQQQPPGNVFRSTNV